MTCEARNRYQRVKAYIDINRVRLGRITAALTYIWAFTPVPCSNPVNSRRLADFRNPGRATVAVVAHYHV